MDDARDDTGQAAAREELRQVDEELAELREAPSADELGDVLFTVVNVGRHLGFDPEAALRGATAKFRRRFAVVEARARERGIDLSTCGPQVLDELWEAAKRSS